MELDKNIDDYILFKQVQFDVPGGKMIADQVLVKYDFLGETIEDVIILENKLKEGTDYTIRQISRWMEVAKGNPLTIRSTGITDEIEAGMVISQNTPALNISKVIRIDGGASGLFGDLQATIENVSNF